MCLFSALLGASLPVAAQDANERFSLKGFGTLGLTRTTSDQVEFVRDLSQSRGIGRRLDATTDSVLGVQAAYRFNDQVEAVVQAVSRYGYQRNFSPEVSWAYLGYDATPHTRLRLGRLGTDFFMFSDSRLVGYSYLTVRPAGDFFWHLPFYSINGADATLSMPFGDDVLRAKLFHGVSDQKVAWADEAWDLSGSRMSGLNLDYLSGPWSLRASYANIRFKNDLPLQKGLAQALPAAQVVEAERYLSTANTGANYYSLGALYEPGDWQFHLMLNQIDQGSQAFESSRAVYALAAHRFGSLTPYMGYSRVYSRQREPRLNAVVDWVMRQTHVDQHTWLLGMRWDFAHNRALKLQWDAIRGDQNSIFPFRREQDGWTGRMNVMSLTFDFLF